MDLTTTLLLFTSLGLVGGDGLSRNAIEFSSARGLEYLKRSQRIDGSFQTTRFQVAAQGLVGLAFLSCGHTPKHGKHAVLMRLGLRRLLEYQTPGGYFTDGESRMYGHGFATLYLAQVLGMWGAPREEAKLREALKKAIELIERSQGPNGGWDYDPSPSTRNAPDVSDCSVTVCQTMALRAARNIGLAVNKTVVDKAFRYIRKAQASSGGFRYRIGTGGLRIRSLVTLGCSAAGVCILNGLGEYDSGAVRQGLTYLRKNYRSNLIPNPFFYYTHYYAAQAFFGTRGRDWEEYYIYIAELLVNHRQRNNGSWRSQQEGSIQATAMAVFVLNVPRAILPISQK